MTGTFLKLIKSYLKSRYQRVVLNSLDSCSDWGVIRHGVPQGSIIGSLFFLFYSNDLPKSINENAETVLVADDTSVIITSLNHIQFKKSINELFQDLNRRFTTNSLILNVNKTQFIQFVTKFSSILDLNIMQGGKTVNICNTIQFNTIS